MTFILYFILFVAIFAICYACRDKTLDEGHDSFADVEPEIMDLSKVDPTLLRDYRDLLPPHVR